MLLSKSGADKSAQDHDSLVVRRSRHARLALDVDNARLAKGDGRGHPRRAAETVTANIQHSQAIDLPNVRAGDVHDERAFRDEPADFLLDKIKPQHPLAEGALDVRGGNALSRLVVREVRRLARE